MWKEISVLSLIVTGIAGLSQSQGGKGCAVIMTNVCSGFGAVAQSGSRVGTSTGYSTQAKAKHAALNSYVLNTPANDSCQVMLQFFDRWW